MNYWINLFSPETYVAFGSSDRTTSGFSKAQKSRAQRVKPGDRFICYMTKLSRWIGVLEVVEGPYEDDTPVFYDESDPYVVRFRVKPLVWLDKEHGIPIHEPELWDQLSFTREHDHASTAWTGKVRASLTALDPEDGRRIEAALRAQAESGRVYEVDEKAFRRLTTHRVRRTDGAVSVTVPESDDEDVEDVPPTEPSVRESIQIQADLARIGHRMGHSIWIPRPDRSRVKDALGSDLGVTLLERLPLNYDDTTIRTIENIDVLWLTKRSIVHAFEVEHTTSVYSGILRMADLLALQPNMDIQLHIVAPESRRDKVMSELRRPVFSLLDRGPLADSCTYLGYEAIRGLLEHPHLGHMSASVLDEYTEAAVEE